ncbi:hypothetical protein CEUSTIGMA_g4736.t1 [Chlamydomonas eustigma]|uniref:Uncharacterized protein n=1 Tax=Chlamydomonas eustigma TaxID=1157962 RepID=A0A250X3E3_9CHLO|nr:hypothetical protein CEUSTIGMA_g4736.t1 [Chlamydomonas eustigma]|eukprot:GAX77290.1 hypothetical protein CEUSTIGMA_g4736.t1 [Chlamydomonas eustigma]
MDFQQAESTPAETKTIGEDSLYTQNYIGLEPGEGIPKLLSTTLLGGGLSSNLTVLAQQLNTIMSTLNVANGVLSNVSYVLGLVNAALGIPVAAFQRDSSRLQFLISEYDFGQTLYTDYNSIIDSSDYIGEVEKYVNSWKSLQEQLMLNSDSVGQLQEQQKYLSVVHSIMKALASFTNTGTLKTG